MESPLVSAVIPVYNGAAFIGDAIRSVLAQTYPHVECIVVDDGSTDDTAAVARGFGDRIRYLYKANGGVSSARNAGIAAALGEYVAFLDADDLWKPEMLERLIGLLRARPDLGLAYAGLEDVDEGLKPIAAREVPEGSVALRNTLLMEVPIVTIVTAGALPARVVRDVGGFDERLSTSADMDFFCRVASRYPVARTAEVLALYRQHGGGQMHLNLRAMEHDVLLVYEKLFRPGLLPAGITALRNRAYANLFLILAVGAYRRGARAHAASYLLKALRAEPRRVVARVGQLAWSALGRKLTREGRSRRVRTT